MVVLTKSACALVDELYFYTAIRRRYFECERWGERVLDYVDTMKPDLVIIGSSGGYPFTDQQLEEGTVAVLKRLINAVARIFVIIPTPLLLVDVYHCGQEIFMTGQRCQSRLQEIRWAKIEEALKRATVRVPGVTLVDLIDLVCPGGICRVDSEGVLFFRDIQHLNGEYVLRRAGDVQWLIEAQSGVQIH